MCIRDRPDGDVSGTGGRGVRRSPQEAWHSARPEGRVAQERGAHEGAAERQRKIEPHKEIQIMTDPDPFEQGERAARNNIPAEANPYRDGSEEHALWAAGHERVAGQAAPDESGDS